MTNWKKYTDRSGEEVVFDDTPPTPPKKTAVTYNSLLYAKTGTLAVDGVQCEKYKHHQFDGTLATCMVMYRFSQSNHQVNSPLCEEHARELIDYLAKFTPDLPYSNTGVTNTIEREEKPK